MLKKIFIIVLLFVFNFACAEQKKSCINDLSLLQINEKDVIKLTGTLHEVICWGAPNFGECPKIDSKFHGWVLYLDKTQVFCNNDYIKVPKKIQGNIIQVRLDLDHSIDKNLEGKRVVVSGVLAAASTPGDIANITMYPPIKLLILKSATKEQRMNLNNELQGRCNLIAKGLPIDLTKTCPLPTGYDLLKN